MSHLAILRSDESKTVQVPLLQITEHKSVSTTTDNGQCIKRKRTMDNGQRTGRAAGGLGEGEGSRRRRRS